MMTTLAKILIGIGIILTAYSLGRPNADRSEQRFVQVSPQATITPPQSSPLLNSTTIQQQIEVIELNNQNMVVMDQVYEDASVTAVMRDLQKLSERASKDQTLYLVLNSPGGDVTSGLRLISFIKALPQKVKTITLFAASMGFQTAQGLDERLILDTGTLMSHRAKFGVSGQGPGEIFSRMNYVMSMVDSLDAIAAARMQMSFDQYRKLIHDEYWVYGPKAVTDHAADRTVLAKCAKDLNGTRTTSVDTIFGTFDVEVSKCPMLPGILSIKKSGADEASPEDKAKALEFIKQMFGNKNDCFNNYIRNNRFQEFYLSH